MWSNTDKGKIRANNDSNWRKREILKKIDVGLEKCHQFLGTSQDLDEMRVNHLSYKTKVITSKFIKLGSSSLERKDDHCPFQTYNLSQRMRSKNRPNPHKIK